MVPLLREVKRYERWLRDQCDVVDADLDYKHKRMRENAFVFLRATYFRWAKTIERVCPELAGAPNVLCIGDIHVENYGIWCDAETRQVWGVNDFDEAAVMPYALDLVRLLTSARLSPHFSAEPASAADALLKGYAKGLQSPGPVLFDEGEPWLRSLVRHLDDAATEFWVDVMQYPDADPPAEVRKALRRTFPKDAEIQRFATRRKGSGGLGRPRFLAIAKWRGGLIVREAKAIVPSAWNWAQSKTGRSRVLDVAYGTFRSPDPSVGVREGFVLRRVAPDVLKLDLKDLAKRGLNLAVLAAMGQDIGSIHAAHRRSRLIAGDLAGREEGWLHAAADRAQLAVERDHAAWVAMTTADGEVVAISR